MSYVTIRAEVPSDMEDPEDPTGVTEEAHNELLDALIDLGLTDVEIKADSRRS